MAPTKKQLAYNAGKAVLSEPPDRRTPEACPFAPDTEEREAWLEGMADALDEQPDPAELKRKVKEARS